jgi:hypothetical protein
MKEKKAWSACGVDSIPTRACSVCGPCTLKSNEAKRKCAGLAQENGFAGAYDLSLLRPAKGAGKWFLLLNVSSTC